MTPRSKPRSKSLPPWRLSFNWGRRNAAAISKCCWRPARNVWHAFAASRCRHVSDPLAQAAQDMLTPRRGESMPPAVTQTCRKSCRPGEMALGLQYPYARRRFATNASGRCESRPGMFEIGPANHRGFSTKSCRRHPVVAVTPLHRVARRRAANSNQQVQVTRGPQAAIRAKIVRRLGTKPRRNGRVAKGLG
jgi:hypothetical protein